MSEKLREALYKCREEFCWHGNTGKKLHADSYAELVDMIDKALATPPDPAPVMVTADNYRSFGLIKVLCTSCLCERYMLGPLH